MRKIIQIACCGVDETIRTQTNDMLYALCEDGTVWVFINGAWQSVPPIPGDAQPDVYVLQNRSYWSGDCMAFWKEGGGGYTFDLDKAKRWTLEEAERQVDESRSSHDFFPRKLDDCLKASVKMVDSERMPR